MQKGGGVGWGGGGGGESVAYRRHYHATSAFFVGAVSSPDELVGSGDMLSTLNLERK